MKEGERPSWYERVLSSRKARLFMLAPLALTAVANATDVINAAKAIVALWKPVLRFIRHLVVESGLSAFISPNAAIYVLIFSPFVIEGLRDFRAGRRYDGDSRTLLAATASFSLIFSWCFLMPIMGRSSAEAVFLPLSLFVVLILPATIMAEINHEESVGCEVLGVIVFGMLIVVGALVLAASMLQTTFSVLFWALVFATSLMSVVLPYINPRRLNEAAALILGIVAISVLGDVAAYIIALIKASP